MKYQKVDLTVPLCIESLEIVVPWPEEEEYHLSAALRPFQPMVLHIVVFILYSYYFLLTYIRLFISKGLVLSRPEFSSDGCEHHLSIGFLSKIHRQKRWRVSISLRHSSPVIQHQRTSIFLLWGKMPVLSCLIFWGAT